MKNAEIMSAPTDETKKAAEAWQAEQAAREKHRAEEKVAKEHAKTVKEVEAKIAERKEALKNQKTNQEIADMEEFKTWCANNNIEATKRQAGKYRDEFEKYLADKKAAEEKMESTIEHKDAA